MALISLTRDRDYRIGEYAQLLSRLKYRKWQSLKVIRLQMEILATIAAELNTDRLLENQKVNDDTAGA